MFLETERPVIFVNAGGGAIKKEGGINLDIEKDCCFEGGDVIRTDESIINGGDIPSVYQSARFGTNLNYKFNDMPAGEYLVDLHFAEIVYTNGPKGMRVFDVYIQEEKASALSPLSSLFFLMNLFVLKRLSFCFKKKWQVISELDVYSIVGANKPLQVVDVRVSVGEDGVIFMRFDGVVGSPIVSGIYIKQATELPSKALVSVLYLPYWSVLISSFTRLRFFLSYKLNAESSVKQELLLCNNCAAEVRVSSDQVRCNLY